MQRPLGGGVCPLRADHNRPLVWPSAAMQREALGLGPTQVKALNRLLIEPHLIVMKDSPNGKRYGKRNGQERIVEAYGFDLAPLAARQAEFLALAEQGRAERERMRLLRCRTIARNGLRQIWRSWPSSGWMMPTGSAWRRRGGGWPARCRRSNGSKSCCQRSIVHRQRLGIAKIPAPRGRKTDSILYLQTTPLILKRIR
jgi:hypothetical protein